MPVPAEALLPAVVVAHPDVVADHVRHGAGEQVRLVGVDVHADADRLRGADGRRYGHAGLAADENLAREELGGVLVDVEELAGGVVVYVR